MFLKLLSIGLLLLSSDFITKQQNKYFEASFLGSLRKNHITRLPCVYTPNGTPVYTNSYTEFSPSTIASLNQDTATILPNAIFLSDASNVYNCHSYAWYMQNSQFNLHWMEDPTNYISDGSYYQIYSGFQVGDIIVYLNDSGLMIHSGRINQLLGGTSNNVCGNANLFQVTSKLGVRGLYSHRGDECIYTSYYPGASGYGLANSVAFYRLSSSHSHSYDYSTYSNSKHFTYCSCSIAFLENHDWTSKKQKDELEYHHNKGIPLYVCTKCGKTSNFPY